MLKKINRVLKLVGLNLVRAKRRKKALKWSGRLMTSTANLEPEWQHIPDNPAGGHTSGYVAIGPNPVDIGADDHEISQVEQKAQQAFEKCCGLDSHPYRVDEIPRVEQPTHSRGCCCAKCIEEFDKPRVQQPNSDNKISGPTS